MDVLSCLDSGPRICGLRVPDLVCGPVLGSGMWTSFFLSMGSFPSFLVFCFSSALPQLLRRRTDGCCEGRGGRRRRWRRRRNCLCSCSLVAPSSHSAVKIVVVVGVSLFPCIHLHRITNHQILCKLFFWSLFEFRISLLVFRRFGIDSFNLLQWLSIQIFWFWFRFFRSFFVCFWSEFEIM